MQKQLLTLCVFLTSMAPIAHAQQSDTVIKPSLKYGKPSMEELSMTTYAPDSAATAVVLYSQTDVRYDMVNGEFRTVYSHSVKIKVLKNEGTSYADIVIPYYNREGGGSKEFISSLDASAYNLENGQVTRTRMKRDQVFTERVDKSHMATKFSIPAVREGTVLEYKYDHNSEIYWMIDPYRAQRDIPVIYSRYDITIPEYYDFSIEMRGGSLRVKETQENLTYTARGSDGDMIRIDCNGRHLSFTGEQLPALRSDSYVWYAEDYMAGTLFELKGIKYPYSAYKSFTRTWKNIDEQLLDDDDFGGMLKMRNPYRDEMAMLLLKQLPDNRQKIAAIFGYLKGKISWNGSYALYGGGTRKAIKEGTGNNADINFVLMSMLRDANIPSYPAVMSRKNRGILPVTHPSINKLNTFVVAIADTDSTFVFLDGSITDGAIDVLPPVLMTNQARLLYDKPEQNRFIDISHLGRNQIRSAVHAQVHPDGKITGHRQTSYAGQHAAIYRRQFRGAKDSADYVAQMENDRQIKIAAYRTEALRSFTERLKEEYDFEKQTTTNGDLIYINPLLFTHFTKSPLTQSVRLLPLEMPYADQYTSSIHLTIPEGYAVEELPKSISFTTEDKQGSCRYFIQQQGNTIVLTYTYTFGNLFYASQDYESVKRFYEMVAEKNNEILVLKKL
ncbi:MAG: DUF3857 domain-containing protein [Mediterranea sp.]|jgi:hypothetical protein|nr:DUF3857 domain-containing protein [Mediterranea sp.]